MINLERNTDWVTVDSIFFWKVDIHFLIDDPKLKKSKHLWMNFQESVSNALL